MPKEADSSCSVPPGHYRLKWVDKALSPDWREAAPPVLVPEEMLEFGPDAEGDGPVVWSSADGEERPAIIESDAGLRPAFALGATIAKVREERYLREVRNVQELLPFHYHRLPASIRALGFRVLSARHRRQAERSAFPNWPADAAVDALHHLGVSLGRLRPRPAWPDGKQFAIVLCHDVDTRKGQEFAPILAEQATGSGLRAAWFVVGRSYSIDHGLWGALHQKGHEIGLHGALHDNRISSLPRPEIAARLDSCRDFVERYRIRGFRSPSLRVSDALYEELEPRFGYDSSVPDSDFAGPWYPRRGCCTVFPFRRSGLLVLPLTLPLDDKCRALGLKPEETLALWRDKLSLVRQLGGLANVTVHCEPHLWNSPAREALYAQLLGLLTGFDDAWLATPREVAEVYNGWSEAGG